ncbi:MAG: cytochrome c family protein [Candidatus Coatesbacteria bacterium]|nr:cytochrome c family protein [Candidatus Coatesbacteria bacterium]
MRVSLVLCLAAGVTICGCSVSQTSLDSVSAESSQPALLDASAKPLAPPGNSHYIGPNECRTCHLEQYDSWQKTAHARSLNVLIDKGKSNSPDCLRCHTTGFGEASGFGDDEASPLLAAVTCEACHGPGSEHASIRKSGGADDGEYGEVNCSQCSMARICIICHRPPYSEIKSVKDGKYHR